MDWRLRQKGQSSSSKSAESMYTGYPQLCHHYYKEALKSYSSVVKTIHVSIVEALEERPADKQHTHTDPTNQPNYRHIICFFIADNASHYYSPR